MWVDASSWSSEHAWRTGASGRRQGWLQSVLMRVDGWVPPDQPGPQNIPPPPAPSGDTTVCGGCVYLFGHTATSVTQSRAQEHDTHCLVLHTIRGCVLPGVVGGGEVRGPLPPLLRW